MGALVVSGGGADTVCSYSRGWIREAASLVPGTREQQGRQENYEGRLRQAASGRLAEVGAVMRELSAAFQEIVATARTKDENRLNSLLAALAARVCEDCRWYSSCWENEFFKTYQNTFELLSLAEVHGGLVKEDIPPGIRHQCQRLPELLSAINNLFDTYRINMQWKQRLDEEREVVATQLAGMAEVMDNLAGELRIDVRALADVTAAIQEELVRYHWQPEQWRCGRPGRKSRNCSVGFGLPRGRVRPAVGGGAGTSCRATDEGRN